LNSFGVDLHKTAMFRASCVVAASGLAHGLTLHRQPVASDGLEEYEPVGLHKDGNRQGSYAPSDNDVGPGPDLALGGMVQAALRGDQRALPVLV